MTSETLKGFDNFSSNLSFNDQNDFDDVSNIGNVIQTYLQDPFIQNEVDEANDETVNEITIGDTNECNDVDIDETNDVETSKIISNENDTNIVYKPIEKLKIIIPPMSSPNMHSSSSESNSPARTKKSKKRSCIKCCIRFKHTVDWLRHLETHISLPSVKLTELDVNNQYYKEYLNRCNVATKRRLSNDTESLKIKLKIPCTETSQQISNEMQTDTDPLKVPTPPPTKCPRIRVMRVEEIKQSPPSPPFRPNMAEHIMVSVPSENRIQYECPTLEGLNQFAEDALNEESTARILKQLLETPNEPPESSELDSEANEFISIDRLAHICNTCNEKYPDLNFLHEHQRLTGHGDRNYSLASILEPIQEMTVDTLHQYRPPQTSRLEHILAQSKNVPAHKQQQPPLQMYGQPPVLPIHQMENQVRTFANMNQMQNRQRFPMQPITRHPSQVPPNYPMHRFMPPSQMVRPNGIQPNQPINMTPFLEMSPDMYNPKLNIPQMNGNGMHTFHKHPNQMMSRFMHQRPNDHNLMQRFPMQQQPLHQSQQRPQRPPINDVPLMRSNRNLPPCALRPNMGVPSGMPLQRQALSPIEQHHQRAQEKARFEQMMRSRELENRPFISNAPRTEGLPVIESVQSGAITLNSTTKKPTESAPTTIQINDQITLSLKNKESSVTIQPTEKRKTPPVDSNSVANILVNRGITVKSTTKLLEKSKVPDDVCQTPYATAEAAVQKLQMNNSVSIISKKKILTPPLAVASSATGETIDLSNDDDMPSSQSFKRPEKMAPKLSNIMVKCSVKTCHMKFSSSKALREHEQQVHRISRLSKFKCTICSLRFMSSEAVRAHIRKTHAGQIKTQPEFGIPIVNFNNSNVRTKMLDLGFTNFLPISNIRDEKSTEFGIPIININGSSINNLRNIFNVDSTKLIPISMRKIARPKDRVHPVQLSSPPSTKLNAAKNSEIASTLSQK